MHWSGLKAIGIFVLLLSQDDFKVTFQKESPKQSLLKVSSEAAVCKGSFPIFTGKRLCCSLSLIKLQLCLKETSTQVFSCEYCEILKTVFFIEHLW